MKLNYRSINFLLFVASVAGMAFALGLQHFAHLEPCPLCIFQRIGLMAMGGICLLAFILNPQKTWVKRTFSLLSTIAISWSVGVAGRHVWLQHLPADEVPSCGPGLQFWLDAFPLNSVIQKVLHGSGECAKVDWSMLGMSLPHWSLLFFVVLLLINLYLLVKGK